MLLMAGSTSTLIAGQIAVARRLPILAVDEFGGSAAKIWNQLAQIEPEKHQSWGHGCVGRVVVGGVQHGPALSTRLSQVCRTKVWIVLLGVSAAGG